MSERYLHLVLPFKLPTWNQLLAMNQWERMEIRRWLKDAVSTCIRSAPVSQTRTGSVRKLSLTALSLATYSQMIQPKSSRKYRSRKRMASAMKRASK